MLSMERTGLREPSAARILLAFMAGDTDGGNTGPRRDSQLWQERPGPSPRWCGRDREASARTRACRSRPVATRLRGLWRLVGPARAGFRACHGTIRRRCPRLPYVSEPHRTAVTADENVVDVFDHGLSRAGWRYRAVHERAFARQPLLLRPREVGQGL